MGIIDLLIVAVIALVTWCVSSEGAVGAGTTFFSVLIAGLLAMNFFEPLADLLDEAGFIGQRADMIALLGLFGGLLTLARLGAERLQPTFVPLHGLLYDVSRWGFAVLTGYATAGILLTALHTAPLPRDFLGFRPERGNLLFDAFGPGRDWLGFTQYVTEKPFARRQRVLDPVVGEIVVPRIFDGRTAYHWGLHTRGSVKVDEEARRTNIDGGAPSDQDLAEAAARIVIPSFAVRYAQRREERYGGIPVDTAPVPAQGGSGVSPSGGGGGAAPPVF